MLDTKVKYSYNDISIVPCEVSPISHRGDCNVLKENESGENTLPLFASPMTTILSIDNFQDYYDNNIIPVLPRSKKITLDERLKYCKNGFWVAFSLNEFKQYFIEETFESNLKIRVCVDLANGHMKDLLDTIKKGKKKYGKEKLIIMTGNIANPTTYIDYCNVGVDYVRCGIGSGHGCITSSNTACHYPMVSLLNEISKLKQKRLKKWFGNKFVTKIIGDGGIRGYSDVIKSLSSGADYVMIGGLFGSTIESIKSEGELTIVRTIQGVDYEEKLDKEEIKSIEKKEDGWWLITFKDGHQTSCDKMKKEFWGMASRFGQKDMGLNKKKTSEGIKKEFYINTTLKQWGENMEDYLKSAMSYCGIKDIKDFNSKNVTSIVISPQTKESINK